MPGVFKVKILFPTGSGSVSERSHFVRDGGSLIVVIPSGSEESFFSLIIVQTKLKHYLSTLRSFFGLAVGLTGNSTKP